MTIHRKLNEKEIQEFTNDYYNRMSKKELLEKYQIGEWGYSVIRKNIPKRTRQASRPNLIPLNERYFENIDTANKAYWLGFISADGCIKERIGKNSYILSVGLGEKDVGHLEKLKNELEYGGKIVTETQLHSKTQKYYTTNYLRISRTILCEDLIKQGVGRDKSKNLKLPNLSDELMRHYIRGLVDGDGGWCINKHNQIIFSFISSVEEFCEDVKYYLKDKCSLENSPNLIFYRNSYTFSYHGNIQCKRIFDYLYSDCNTYLDRKYKLCSEHFKNLNNHVKIKDEKIQTDQIIKEQILKPKSFLELIDREINQ